MCARHPLEIYGATAQQAPGKAFQLPHPSLKQKQCAQSSDEDFNIYIYQALKTGSCTFFSEQSTFIEQSVDKAQLGALCPGIDCWGGQGAGTQTVPSAARLAPLGYTEPSLQFNILLPHVEVPPRPFGCSGETSYQPSAGSRHMFIPRERSSQSQPLRRNARAIIPK